MLTKQISKEQHYQIKRSYSKDSFKYFIGYRHKGNVFLSPLCIKLPQMNTYAKYFGKNNKYMNHLAKDEKNYKKIFKNME